MRIDSEKIRQQLKIDLETIVHNVTTLGGRTGETIKWYELQVRWQNMGRRERFKDIRDFNHYLEKAERQLFVDIETSLSAINRDDRDKSKTNETGTNSRTVGGNQTLS